MKKVLLAGAVLLTGTLALNAQKVTKHPLRAMRTGKETRSFGHPSGHVQN